MTTEKKRAQMSVVEKTVKVVQVFLSGIESSNVA